jgi:hypothetical protein
MLASYIAFCAHSRRNRTPAVTNSARDVVGEATGQRRAQLDATIGVYRPG